MVVNWNPPRPRITVWGEAKRKHLASLRDIYKTGIDEDGIKSKQDGSSILPASTRVTLACSIEARRNKTKEKICEGNSDGGERNRLVESNEVGDTRADNLLANRGCKN